MVCIDMHHRYCRRTIFHVLFWRKSSFCVVLETMSAAIEALFDTSVGNVQSAVLGFLKAGAF